MAHLFKICLLLLLLFLKKCLLFYFICFLLLLLYEPSAFSALTLLVGWQEGHPRL